MIRVLGVDPGTEVTGVGLVFRNGSAEKAGFIGTIRVRKDLPLAVRLNEIHRHLENIIREVKPTVVAVETCFYHHNFKSAVKIGEARALVLVAAAGARLEVVEYPPARIKHAICGNGAASKKQMQYMVRKILGLPRDPQEDAADALSVALCHLHSCGALGRLAGVSSSARKKASYFVRGVSVR